MTTGEVDDGAAELTPSEKSILLKRITSDPVSATTPVDPAWDQLFQIGNRLARANRNGVSATEELTSNRR